MNELRPLKRGAELLARRTTERDLDFVMWAERAPENRDYVIQWSRAQHVAVMADREAAHWIVESRDQPGPVGFVIWRPDEWRSGGFEFKRLVVTRKGAGYGRAAVRLVKRAAFELQNAHRLWLDVFDFNVRARHLYETEGFVVEGTRRECLRRGDRYVSAIVMSMLESEYRSERQVR